MVPPEGAEAENSEPEQQTEPEGAEDWQDGYKERIRRTHEAKPPAEQVSDCAQLNALSDDEFRLAFGSQAGGETTFDTYMTEIGMAPTVDDYNEGIKIAIDESRDLC